MQAQEKSIKYIAFYNDDKFGSVENRNTSLAVTNKANYICTALNKLGYNVEIISPSWSNNSEGFYKGHLYNISSRTKLRNFSTFGTSNDYTGKIKHYYAAIQLLLYLLFKTKKNEQIIVYHSLALMIPIKFVKLIKKLDVILEVEEVYSDVWKGSYNNKKELGYICSFKKYIFASDLLKERIGNKQSIVLYGAYNGYKKEKKHKESDDIVNLVYAGSIDSTKGGSEKAVKCMKFLPNNYRLHILGFGEDNEVKKLINSIEEINSNKGYTSCIYHGTLYGKEYDCFLLSCDIGLNPQIEGEYMDTAFPSKILSYMSHDLTIVSTSIESIKKSEISKYIIFTENDLPESIAKTIHTIDLGKTIKNNNIIKKLDFEFQKKLEQLLSAK